MKKLQNTLYVTTPDKYLSLDGENVVILQEQNEIGRVPLHNLDGIVTFGYTGASPALMGKCAKDGKSLVFMSGSGRFLARVEGQASGNVFLRRQQYRFADDPEISLKISENMIAAKLYNSRWVLERTVRDHELRIDKIKFKSKSEYLKNSIHKAFNAENLDELRGIEGEAASVYFSVFDDMILQQKEDFFFKSRSKRPPLDRVNALLSFAYSFATGMCASALEAVGLDPYVGFMHTDRPGRHSLALDLLEEFRALMCDRFVLMLINKRMIGTSDFEQREDGAVLLTDNGRKTFITAWQNRKHEEIKHPFLGEKVEWGLLPYVQALLLARYIRGDLDCYPPFMWK
ncbi:MAG: type I-C CRISPR-associated endonuclease Cas1c [Acutalibacteraceae bacterium]